MDLHCWANAARAARQHPPSLPRSLRTALVFLECTYMGRWLPRAGEGLGWLLGVVRAWALEVTRAWSCKGLGRRGLWRRVLEVSGNQRKISATKQQLEQHTCVKHTVSDCTISDPTDGR